MKCAFCGKPIDDMDCSCKMCTICGWSLDVKAEVKADVKADVVETK